MIHNELCTYEVAKLAKEKGFPQHPKENDNCQIYCWDNLRKIHSLCISAMWDIGEYSRKDMYAAPTQSLLQRWLREEKHCNIEIAVCPAPISIWIFVWSVSYGADSHYSHRCNYDTYELALEDALAYSLKNLA